MTEQQRLSAFRRKAIAALSLEEKTKMQAGLNALQEVLTSIKVTREMKLTTGYGRFLAAMYTLMESEPSLGMMQEPKSVFETVIMTEGAADRDIGMDAVFDYIDELKQLIENSYITV